MSAPSRFVLLDANVVAAYYAPQTLRGKQRAPARIRTMIDAVKRGGWTDVKLLIPNLCIAEVFTTFSRHAHVGWRKDGVTPDIDAKTYGQIFDEFARDIHNGAVIEQWELNRYHVLARHFIAPVDHHTRVVNAMGKPYKQQLGATDQMVAGMASWLVNLFGHERFRLVTCDHRLVQVLRRGRVVTDAEAAKWGLRDLERRLGIRWDRRAYPDVIDLERDADDELRTFFGIWPLPTQRFVGTPTMRVTKEQKARLVQIADELGVGRDRLPYSPDMTRLIEAFRAATGHVLTEPEMWHLLLGALKQGRRKVHRRAEPGIFD